MSTETADSALPQLGSLAKIPGLDSGLDYARQLYSFGKASTKSMPLGIPEMIETAEHKLTTTVVPLLKKHRPRIEEADIFASDRIDEFQQLVTEVSSNVRSAAVAAEVAVASPLQRTAAVVSDVMDIVLPDDGGDEMESPLSWTATVGKIITTVTKQGQAPASDQEVLTTNTESESTRKIPVVPGAELRATVSQYRNLATKTNTRAAKHAMLRINAAKLRANGTVASMKKHTVDLIEYAKINIDRKAQATTGLMGIPPPPTIDDVAAMATERLATCHNSVKDSVTHGTDKLFSYAEQAKEHYAASRVIVGNKTTEVIETASAAREATTEYIAARRAVILAVLVDATKQLTAKFANLDIEGGADVHKMISSTETWEQVTMKMEGYTKQARLALTNLAGSRTVASLSERALAVYERFEQHADPYMFSLLSKIRDQVSCSETVPDNDDEGNPAQSNLMQEDCEIETEDTGADGNACISDFHDATTGWADESVDEVSDPLDQGLVLNVSPSSAFVKPARDSDIDDETDLLRVPRVGA